MKKVAGLVVLMLAVSMASAETVALPDSLDVKKDEVDLDRVKKVFNANSDQVPGFVASLVGGQRINLYLEGENYSKTVKIDMDGVEMDAIEKGEWGSPSLEVWVSVEDVNRLLASERPLQELRAMLENGEIRYREHGLINSIRFLFLELFL
ncbi:MAG: hypothetical protein SVS85_04360 [Candidatus Nanohaloarchaea archaeon]|nr:hypothetical protein [Candidatus Nanohaloarchaea archaeon]